jgi:protein TonB
MMVCLTESDLQRCVEEAGAGPVRRLAADHLADCADCRMAFQQMAATHRRVDGLLEALSSPEDNTGIDVRGALALVRRRVSIAGSAASDAHLGRLLAPAGAEMPWYLSLYGSLRDLIRPEKLPPLELTSRPVPVTDIWGVHKRNHRSRFVAAGIHVAVFSLLMFGFSSPIVQQAVEHKVTILDPNLNPFIPTVTPAQGGGGGGAREPLPVSKGQAPKPALRQFTPPRIIDETPKLAMTPTIVAPPETVLPQNNMSNWGDPLARLSTLSNGPGSGGGMGAGHDGGLGPGDGPGFGPGGKGGVGEGVFNVGAGVSKPVVIYKIDPEYSEEARKAKYSGIVELAVIVDTDGHAREIRVAKSLGMGLDEKAIEAVAKWKFKPGMKGGQAVNVRALIDVNFRLL